MQDSSEWMINAEGLTKRFGDRTAVDSISFQVGKGEILGFLGPNAAGKTTTMKMLTCFFPPTSGRVSVNGFDVIENSLDVRRSVGFLPENVPLYTEMTVKEYVEFVARAKSVPHLERDKAIKEAIGRCNLDSVANQLIRTISRGYKQRVGLAQAIVNNPPVLILDEPTVGLDPAQIKDIRELIKSFGGKSTVILSTHILPEVSLTCERVAILNHGKIIVVDTPDNLVHRVQADNILVVSIGDVPDPEAAKSALSEIEGVKSVEEVNQADGSVTFEVHSASDVELNRRVSSLVISKGWSLDALEAKKASLEDIFINLVTHEDEAEAEREAKDADAGEETADSADSDAPDNDRDGNGGEEA